MLDVVDPHPEALVADEEAADDAVRPGEVHRQFWPEMPVQQVPRTRLRPGGKSPVALRVTLDDGSGFDLTEAGTRKGLSVWMADDLTTVEQLTSLGPDAVSLRPPLESPPLVVVGSGLRGLPRRTDAPSNRLCTERQTP